MKDPKEEASHRISNLKNMMHNVKEEEKSPNSFDEDELEEDEELIRFLNERHQEEEYEMNDSYIYHPGKDNPYEVNLDDDEIDENYIIKTDLNDETNEFPYSGRSLDYEEKIGENFDNIVSMEIHEKPVLAIISLVVGIILIVFSIIVLNSGTERIVDNVVSGENNYITVVLLILGLLLIIYAVFKLFNINPFHNMMESIENIEENNTPNVKEKLDEPQIPESNIPLDKESFKIGEFNIDELKTSLKRPFGNNNSKVKREEEEINVEELPSAREKSKSEKGLIEEEIEEKNYKQARLDGESIDEIFSQVKEFEKKK